MKRKVDWSSYKLVGFVLIFFALFFAAIFQAYHFAQNKQLFIKDSALFVAGDVEVYATYNGVHVKLSEMSRGNLGATLTSGDRKYTDKKLKTTGDKIVLYSVDKNEGKVYQLILEETENEKTRVTLEGRKKTHIYDTPTRFRTYRRMLTTEDEFRENIVVNVIPVVN